MSKNQQPTKREKTTLNRKEVRDLGVQIAYLANAYASASGEMEQSAIEAISVKGASNLHQTLKRLNGAIQSLQSALHEARTAPLTKHKQDMKATQQAATDAADASAAKKPQKPKRSGGSKS